MSEKWLYVGVEKGQKKGQKLYAYKDLTPTEGEGETRFYGKKLADCQPGWVIEVEVTHKEGGFVTVTNAGKCDTLCAWGTPAERQYLQAVSRAVEVSFETAKRAAQPEYLTALEPLRAAYRKTNTAGKRKLLAEFIEYMTR